MFAFGYAQASFNGADIVRFQEILKVDLGGICLVFFIPGELGVVHHHHFVQVGEIDVFAGFIGNGNVWNHQAVHLVGEYQIGFYLRGSGMGVVEQHQTHFVIEKFFRGL